MTKLLWHNPGRRTYEHGIERGVLYPNSGPGLAWNGLISVEETPSDYETAAMYYDGKRYANRATSGVFSAVLEAYTYPELFEQYQGGSFMTNPRKSEFGLSYRTLLGNDLVGSGYGYFIHLVYNAMVKRENTTYESDGGDHNLTNFSWLISTRPSKSEAIGTGSHLIIDSSVTDPEVLRQLENTIYGDDTQAPRLPTFDEVFQMFGT